MRENQVTPSVSGDQSVTGRQINPQLPFFSTDLAF
jgi:hypothetical protein